MSDVGELILSGTADAWALPDEAPTASWRARRRLAAALRALNEASVLLEDEAEVLEEVAHRLEDVVALVGEAGTRTYMEALMEQAPIDRRAVWVDRIAVVGRSNPLAPPIKLFHDDAKAWGEVRYSHAYQGPPGHVHGGHVAAGFDQVCGYVQVMRGIPCMTGGLEVRYRRPTPLDRPLRFEAELDSVTGREHRVNGRLVAVDEPQRVLATAVGTFIEMSLEALAKKLGG